MMATRLTAAAPKTIAPSTPGWPRVTWRCLLVKIRWPISKATRLERSAAGKTNAATIAAGASTAVAAGATATDTASPAGDATATIVTAPPVGAPPSISLDAPATASGDFTVTVRLDGVAQPYTGFNVYLTFDPSVVTSTGGTAGAALASSPDQYFCTGAADKVPGAESLGCTLLGTTSTNNGVLATFAFQRIGPGTTQLHMRTATDGGAIQGTYIIVNVGDSPTPLDIVVNDASVVVS